MLMQQVKEAMTVIQELKHASNWIWITSEQMGFPLWSEFSKENHGEAGSSKQCNHCFWQVSDSVCTTVLTMTLSQKKKTALRAVFLLDCPHQT